MQRIEFDAKVENGKITIPNEFRDDFQEIVHVVISSKKKKTGKSYLQELIDNPIEIPDFEPMTRDEIYDRQNW